MFGLENRGETVKHLFSIIILLFIKMTILISH